MQTSSWGFVSRSFPSRFVEQERVPGSPIDGFHGDVIRLQSQKSEVLRILIYTRLKINRK